MKTHLSTMAAVVFLVITGTFAGPPGVEYFRTSDIPISGLDAPGISNHWLWAQAGSGILNMLNVRDGAAAPRQGTTVVRINGIEVTAGATADWWPNQVVRRSKHSGLELTGTVRTTDRKYALLSCLEIHNPGRDPTTFKLQFEMAQHTRLQALVEPGDATAPSRPHVVDFTRLTIAPGESRTFRIVTLLRGSERGLSTLVSGFDDEWAASNRYWNALLADAFDPEPGLFLSGGMPSLDFEDPAVTRLYRFGVITALMCLKSDPDRRSPVNWYGTSMPDTIYGTESFIWDVGYASPTLAQLDPAALRNVIEHWAMEGVHHRLAVPYHGGTSILGPRFYAASGSLFTWSVLNYLKISSDYGWLETKVRGMTLWEHLLALDAWHEARPKWNGLSHYGEEKNLFDDNTVSGYQHFVAAPNAAAVWIKRRLADLVETQRGDSTTARRLRTEATQLAKAIVNNLYQSEGDYSGTWRQRHADGTSVQNRHGWDFMNAGTFLAEDLTSKQRRQMRDWFVKRLARPASDAIWMVSQDPRDGNNGPHQMEHNGRGAYPAWPFHSAWALQELGFAEDAKALVKQVAPIAKWGAISQGNDGMTGQRCRSGWASVAGTSLASMVQESGLPLASSPGAKQRSPAERRSSESKNADSKP